MTTQQVNGFRASRTSDVVGRRIRAFLDDRKAVPGASRRDRVCTELVEAGWQTFDGSLTVSGARLRADLATTPATLHLASQNSWSSRQGWIRVGATRALAVIQTPSSNVTLEVMPSGVLPIFLAEWAGLESTLTNGEVFDAVDADSVARRVWDRTEPLPQGADPRLEQLWKGSWQQWSISREDTDIELSYIAVQGHGHFLVHTDAAGRTLLCQRPGSLLWGDIQALVSGLPSRTPAVDADDAPHW